MGTKSEDVGRRDFRVKAETEVVHVSVLQSARELGRNAILVASKPDLTGKRVGRRAQS